MSKIDDLLSPKKEVTFRGEKFMLDFGFTLEETPMITKAFGEKHSIDVKADGMKEILKLIVKRLYPEATEEEISKVDVKYSQDLLDVFFQLDDTKVTEKENIKKILKNKTGK